MKKKKRKMEEIKREKGRNEEREEYGKEVIRKREGYRECVAFLLAALTLHPLVLVTRW